MQTLPVHTGDTGTAEWADNLRDDAYGGSILRPHQQATPGMTLYVENGAYYVNGIRYLFAGGSTPTFTAPVSNPRIDLVTIDTSGTIAIVEGTEAPSPSVPAYPENVITLCEVYHVVGETAIYTANSANYGWTSSQGYIQNDVRPMVGYGPNFAAIGEDLIPDTTNTRSLGSSSKQWEKVYGEQVFVNGAPVAGTKFGGTGADGALSISSGTTTIDLGGAAYVEKNYTSISITGTGQLAFSNPHPNGTTIVIKSQGNVTLTSSTVPCINAAGMGAKGASATTTTGTGQAGGGGGASVCSDGSAGDGGTFGGSPSISGYANGNPAYGIGMVSPGQGGQIISGTTSSGPAGTRFGYISSALIRSMLPLIPGSGGGSGSGTGTNGAGGYGGAAAFLECAGYLNFTGTVSAAGTNGGNVSTGNSAGGGGGGGVFIILANYITTNTGTIVVSGGPGGTGGAYNGGSGAPGFGYSGLNTVFA